ncbi:MAG: hypothetical protein IJ800_00500, partial [Clostridia bacterium]|nr:hypothetical protein [Clostridia bacterium]
ALKSGKRVMAKIQINNSWECSAVPCLPVFGLVKKHLDELKKIGVNDYFLTWTLGGYPSPIMDMIAAYNRQGDGFDLDKWYKEYFGEEAERVKKASELLCEGFEEYPFSVEKIYFGPHNLGPADRWSLSADNNLSTMVCYSFDDYETWIYPYSYENYLSQMDKLCEKWKKGAEILKESADEKAKNLSVYAEVSYIHFLSDRLHTEYAKLKRDIKANAKRLIEIIDREREITDRLLFLVDRSPIAFETSNHYFYTERNLKIKLLELDLLKEELAKRYL